MAIALDAPSADRNPRAGADALLYESVILLDDVVHVMRCSMTAPTQFAGLLQFGEGSGVRRMPVHTVDHQVGRLLAYVTGLVNQELLLQNEYLAAKNRILRLHLPARLRSSDPQRSTLAEIGKRLGRKALAQVACVAKPDTILASQADRSQVRRLEVPILSRPTTSETRDR